MSPGHTTQQLNPFISSEGREDIPQQSLKSKLDHFFAIVKVLHFFAALFLEIFGNTE